MKIVFSLKIKLTMLLVRNFGIEESGNAAQNLFFWSLMHNRIEMAKIFWKNGRV
jgi:hypothetical protein